ncbi:MAG: PA14 domain-containing protein, partial [Pirellulales bacterium]|nr:PA14 domain-containing protein [Pirellulales bacterium]
AQADALLDGTLASDEDELVTGVPAIDFEDEPFDRNYINLFKLDQDFPGDPEGKADDDDHFTIRATAKLVVRDTWLYSFLINVDDGSRLRIDGRDVIVDDGVHPPQVSIGTVALQAGVHDLELVAYDKSVFSCVELATAVGRTRHLQDFRLLKVAEE